LLATWLMMVSCLTSSLNLKMKATCFSENSVGFQRTTPRYIPEDRTLHNHRCENLKSYRVHRTGYEFDDPARNRNFCCITYGQGLGPTWQRTGRILDVNRRERESSHSASSGAEVCNAWSLLPLDRMLSWRGV
jgi:hypothetical protein